MAEPRRVQLTTLSSNVPLQSAVGVIKPALPPKEELTVTPVAASTSTSRGSPTKQPVATSNSSSQGTSTKLVKTERFVLTLFEPDQHRCPEFYYPELVYKKKSVSDKDLPNTIEQENREKDELGAIARRFEDKYGCGNKRKKDRIQDLVDIGYGYDNEDSFIDNSEAYDELVPASLSTKLGGFYVNSGPLQFRQASDTETDDDFMTKNQQPKPPKVINSMAASCSKYSLCSPLFPSVLPDKNMWEEKPKKKKRKKPAGPLSVTDMLRKFQKQKDKEKLKREREREQQKFGLEKTTLPTTPYVSADPAGGGANMADPLLSLIGSTNDRAFLQAASTVDFDLDLDTLLDPPPQPTPLPEGLSPAMERRAQDLALVCYRTLGFALCCALMLLSATLIDVLVDLVQAAKGLEGDRLVSCLNYYQKLFLIQCRDVSGQVRSKVYTHLASFLPCSRETLLKRVKKLLLTQQ
uniref:Hpc2-related domain-containing protein n=1 Tax=Oncorhynchus tshawytscha TaxID=74940 RepID=A0A8C8LRK4_ONCTS